MGIHMEEIWDVAIIEGEPVKLLATSEDEMRGLLRLVNERPEQVAAIVRAKRENSDQGVTLWLDPRTLDRVVEVPQDLL